MKTRSQVVAQGQAHDCEVTQLSNGAARVRLPADIAESDDLYLRLPGPNDIKCELLWRNGQEMALRLLDDPGSEDQTPAIEQDEQRRYSRTAVMWVGTISSINGTSSCDVIDVSAFGAGLSIPEGVECGKWVILATKRLEETPGRVAWIDGDRMGIEFLEDPDVVARRLAQAIPPPAKKS